MWGFGSQHVARYHIETSKTWLATKILSAKDKFLCPQDMSFPFREVISLLKLASMGRRNPTYMPRYMTPSPSGIHFRPTSCPQSHSLLLLLVKIVVDVPQLTLAPKALQKISKTALVLFILARNPFRYKAISSAKVWSLTHFPLGRIRPSTSCFESSSK